MNPLSFTLSTGRGKLHSPHHAGTSLSPLCGELHSPHCVRKASLSAPHKSIIFTLPTGRGKLHSPHYAGNFALPTVWRTSLSPSNGGSFIPPFKRQETLVMSDCSQQMCCKIISKKIDFELKFGLSRQRYPTNDR